MGRTRGKLYEVVKWMEVIEGDRIKRHRNRKDLTQRELAFLVGCTQTTIYMLETGQMRTLTEKLALKIAKRLDLPWEDLFVARESRRTPSVTNDSGTARRSSAVAGTR